MELAKESRMHVRSATMADVHDIAVVAAAGFFNAPTYCWLFPRRAEYPEDWYRFFARKVTKELNTSNVLVAVAETEDSQIAGYIAVHRQGGGGLTTPDRVRETEQNSYQRALVGMETAFIASHCLDRAVDPAALAAMNDIGPELQRCFRDYPQHWYMAPLVISPAFQRRGVGGMLVQWSFGIAASEPGLDVAVTLTASIVGKGLYEKQGFKTVDYRTVQAEGTMLPNPAPEAAMVWLPSWRLADAVTA